MDIYDALLSQTGRLLVLADVASVRHAEKAIAAGVDGWCC